MSIAEIISLVWNAINSLYNFLMNKKNLKIDIINSYHSFSKENEKYIMLVKCNIRNNCRFPITISSIDLPLNNFDYSLKAFHVPVAILGDTVKIFDQTISYDKKSIELPCYLNPYDSLETTLIFLHPFDESDNNIFFAQRTKLIFNTSRGRISKNIEIFDENN